MLHIQHYIKTVHFWLKYNGLAIVQKTTKLTESGHRGLQDCRHSLYVITYTFLRIFYVFFQNPKSRDLLRFLPLPCFVRFLELWRTRQILYNTLTARCCWQNGELECTTDECPMPSCPTPIKIEGQCCPVCPGWTVTVIQSTLHTGKTWETFGILTASCRVLYIMSSRTDTVDTLWQFRNLSCSFNLLEFLSFV